MQRTAALAALALLAIHFAFAAIMYLFAQGLRTQLKITMGII